MPLSSFVSSLVPASKAKPRYTVFVGLGAYTTRKPLSNVSEFIVAKIGKTNEKYELRVNVFHA
jgi:hypothetical protein